ncbi:hypothetical protein POPTR_003G146500v4 [Populus trichocarpa]|uniref:AB hydrolase-1 domain-containing protein n=1 Tax=Populus trichocarpa TaxID=3694 RepID=B9GY32_POPTR|nr:embryogenesis-associated protein EMB8 isoform X1 [Populus trichocarpa]PNT45640.1 hypothetical protein POPTR_003G146500v4 [Populus trichocarpa]|eukprot:XP_002303690.2 embryogenesis-associated protein EMB8 isoform X1 [Populus trichocarpa]
MAKLSLTPISTLISPVRRHRPPHSSLQTTAAASAAATTTTTTTTNTMPDQHTPHPSLEIIGGARDLFLPAFNSLHRPYTPFPLLGNNCHVETIFASFFRATPDARLKRECLRTKDDGAVALDWVSGDHQILPPNSPVLILLPGLTGGSGDSYVRHMLIKARNKGWRVVVFNSRGCGNSPVTTPQFYSASFIGDMHEVVAHVGTRYPNANLYAVGWSLGANILVNYLAQEPQTITGAVSLCNPFNLVIADEDFRKGFNVVYDKALTNALRKILKNHAILFEDMGGEYNIPLAANAKSVREFDEGLTRVSFGFKSVDDYYSNSCSSDSIKHVRTPLLCIQAANDPIAPARGIPYEDIKENPNCLLIVTPKGGHLGWIAGSEAPLGAPWTDTIVMDFLEYLQSGACEAPASHSGTEGVQHSTEAMHHLKL